MKKLFAVLFVICLVSCHDFDNNLDPFRYIEEYYSLNGNAENMFDFFANGSVAGAKLTRDKNGDFNKAYEFENNEDYIDCHFIGDLSGMSEFTISLWFMYSGDNSSDYLLGKFDESGNKGFYFQIDSSGVLQFKYYVEDGDSIKTLEDDNWGVDENTWKCLALTGKQNEAFGTVSLKLYLDGTLLAYVTDKNLKVNIFSPLVIGHRSTSKDYHFSGKADDLRIYKKELTAGEVAAIFNSTDPISSYMGSLPE